MASPSSVDQDLKPTRSIAPAHGSDLIEATKSLGPLLTMQPTPAVQTPLARVGRPLLHILSLFRESGVGGDSGHLRAHCRLFGYEYPLICRRALVRMWAQRS